jgi:hypothetical protein
MKRKTHWTDIRLKNNAGINFPACCAQVKMLDLDKTRYTTTGEKAKVTCKTCLRVFPKRYDWATR